jgi:hypothetical protein
MTPRGPDPDEQHAQEEVSILKLRVGLVLLAEARRRGDFGSEEELAGRAAELADEMSGGAPSPRPGRPLVEADLYGPDRIGLSGHFSQSGSSVATLGLDGILYEEATVVGFGLVNAEPMELDEEEQAGLERRAEWRAQLERRQQFTATRFLRAVAAAAQPGAATRILAVMLFTDGFYVEHTWDEEPGDLEEIDSAADFFAARNPHQIRVEDDLGTEYLEGDGSWGGVRVSRGSSAFSPAPPTEARLLRITTDNGTVELDLQL